MNSKNFTIGKLSLLWKFQFITILLIMLTHAVWGQKKIIARSSGVKGNATLSKVFKKYGLFSINTQEIGKYAKQNKNKGQVKINLDFPGKATMKLEIREDNLLASNYQLIAGTAKGKRKFAKPACITYSGKLANDDRSSVYLTITEKNIYGSIKGNGKEYFIEPLRYFSKQATDNEFVLYETKDVITNSGIDCGVKEIKQKLNEIKRPVSQTLDATIACKQVEFAIASDESMFLKYGTVEAVEEHNISVLNAMRGIYSNAVIGSSFLDFKLTEQYVSTSAANDPLLPAYDGNDAFIFLDNFAAWGEAGNFTGSYDLAQYWTARPEEYIDGLAMGIGTVCTSKRYNLCRERSSSLSYLASLSAHEVGHCLGAYHDFDYYAPFIMGALFLNPVPTTFSNASLSDMNAYISSSEVTCLTSCNTPPTALFSVSGVTLVDDQMQTCIGNNITFNDNSLGEISEILWTFQDGSPATSTTENPVVSFNTPGLKTIQLTVSNAFGSSTISKTINVKGEIMPGTLTASATSVCSNARFQLTYTGEELGYLQFYDNEWVTGLSINRNQTITLTPYPNTIFETFRIMIPGTPCPKFSNTVRVDYLPVPKPVITGPDFICTGASSATLQVSGINENEPPFINYLWNPGGETTSLITVNPSFATTYTVEVTGPNGCKSKAAKQVLVGLSSTPVIKSSIEGQLCAGTGTTLSFTGTKSVNGCTNSSLPQWPSNAVDVANCNGNYEFIVGDAFAGEYSVVNVEAGKYYAFKMLTQNNQLSADVITVSDANGSTIFATGTSLAVWKASFTGQVRYYSHKVNCVAENVNRKKYIACSELASSFGTFKWMPGEENTESINISPTSSSLYSLTFTNQLGCSATSTLNVIVNIVEWIFDNDSDGYYSGSPVISCTSPGNGYIIKTNQQAGDCNDGNADIKPGALELCDGIDNNCNGLIDEGVKTTFFKDADLDGFGNPAVTTQACSIPAGYVTNNTDCNDANAALNPTTVWIRDVDADGYYTGTQVVSCTTPGSSYQIRSTQLAGDCSDNNASVNPAAVEVCGNGIDDNCNGTVDENICYPCQNATNLITTNITATGAQLNWTAVANPVQWQVQYKTTKQGSKWVDVFLTGNKRSVVLNGLLNNQNYQWQIRAKCGNNWTSYISSAGFKTGAANLLSSVAVTDDETVAEPGIMVYPNPTQGLFMLEMQLPENDNSIVNIQVIDLTGRILQTEIASITKGYLKKNMSLHINFTKGIYLLRIIAGNKTYTTRLVYEK